ncbi:unnamed protein product, partial [Rotaria magnacalcarata]
SLLVSRLTRLRVVSLVNTTSSYIPPQALAVLINMTVLEIESCGLYEIPSTISLLTKLQQLRLSKNHLRSATHSTGNFSILPIKMDIFQREVIEGIV